MHYTSGLLAVTSNLASSTATDGSTSVAAWQTLVVAALGIAGAAAMFAITLAYKQLVPVKVRKR